jgi:hypothetical protein
VVIKANKAVLRALGLVNMNEVGQDTWVEVCMVCCLVGLAMSVWGCRGVSWKTGYTVRIAKWGCRCAGIWLVVSGGVLAPWIANVRVGMILDERTVQEVERDMAMRSELMREGGLAMHGLAVLVMMLYTQYVVRWRRKRKARARKACMTRTSKIWIAVIGKKGRGAA